LFVVCPVCVVFSFCDDHQFIDVNRCEKRLWSTGRWWFRCVAHMCWILLFWALL